MAFREISRQDAARIPGFLQDEADISPQDRDLARSLMLTFSKTFGFAQHR
jgi:hypothetical protein